jgi:uncharacterized membrane protein YgcG
MKVSSQRSLKINVLSVEVKGQDGEVEEDEESEYLSTLPELGEEPTDDFKFGGGSFGGGGASSDY